MANTRAKKGLRKEQGNAIENEIRHAESPDDELLDDEFDADGVSEEESKLAEDYPDGGESAGKKF